MFKRGQISVFIILGIVIVAGVAFFLFSQQETATESEPTPETAPIKLFIDSCISKVAEEGLFFIALQGGYYNAPQLSRPYSFITVPYYWDNQNSFIPSKNVIEGELSKYIDDNLPDCFGDFESFKEEGFDFELEDVSSDVTIAPNLVSVNVLYPIKITKGASISSLRRFISDVEIDFNGRYEIVKEILEEQKNTPNSVPLGYISALAFEQGFTFETIDMGDGEVIYTLLFDEKGEGDFIYAFAARYDWSDLQ